MNPIFINLINTINDVPSYVNLVFVLTVFLSIYLFYKATNKSKTVLIIIILWIAFQGVLAYTGFYQNTKTIPPRLVLIGVPPLILIIFLFISKKGRFFIDGLDEKTLTILHTIRIPMEIVLWWLFIYKTIPQLMTFEGRNYDILIGLTAPFVYYFGYIKNKFSNTIKLIWNFVGILLLANVVFYAILSIETGFQQFAFEQPNIAIIYFPFIWLPCCVVPIAFLSHFAIIRQLLKS